MMLDVAKLLTNKKTWYVIAALLIIIFAFLFSGGRWLSRGIVSENYTLKSVYYRDTTPTTSDSDGLLPDGYGFYVMYSTLGGINVPGGEKSRPFLIGVCKSKIPGFEFPPDGSIIKEYGYTDALGGFMNLGVHEVYCPVAK